MVWMDDRAGEMRAGVKQQERRSGGKQRRRASGPGARHMLFLVGLITAVSVTGAPSAQANPPSLYNMYSDCGVIIECGLRPLEPLVYRANEGEQRVAAELEVFMSPVSLDRACSPVQHVEFGSYSECKRGERSIILESFALEAGGTMQPGWNRYDAKITHDFTQATSCEVWLGASAIHEDGSIRDYSCMGGVRHLLWNRAGDGVLKRPTREEQQRVQAVGESYPLPFSFELPGEDGTLYTLSFDSAKGELREIHHLNGTFPSSGCDAPLDELIACSGDQFPVCGCDGRVWESPCEAARAGVGIYSPSPYSPRCHELLRSTHSSPTLMPDPIVSAGGQDDEASMCFNEIEPSTLFNSVFAQSRATQNVSIVSDPLSPRAIIPWEALFYLSPREQYHYTGYVKQDMDRVAEQCLDKSHRLSVCGSDDPCCGREQGQCDAHEERLRRCRALGDTDCDGLPDEFEVGVGVDRRDQDEDGLLDGLEARLGTRLDARDSDQDGVSDFEEWYTLGTDPTRADTDEDGVPDGLDPEPLLADRDGDGLLDGADLFPDDFDQDRDGLAGLLDDDDDDPDQDGDGLLDGAELAYDFSQAGGVEHMLPWPDSDGDGLTDEDEKLLGSSPTERDTDGDGLTDLQELYYGSSATDADTDGDGLTDFDEVYLYHTYPDTVDTDEDGLRDFEEVLVLGSNPRLLDMDSDGYQDGIEIKKSRTSLASRDMDGGGLDDAIEWMWGGDYYDASDDEELRVMSVLHGYGEGGALSFMEADGELVARMRVEVFNVDESAPVESLSDRAVALPYHQGMQLSYYEPGQIDLDEFILALKFDAPGAIFEPGKVARSPERGQELFFALEDDPSTVLRLNFLLSFLPIVGKESGLFFGQLSVYDLLPPIDDSFALEDDPRGLRHMLRFRASYFTDRSWPRHHYQERITVMAVMDRVRIEDLGFDPFHVDQEVCSNGVDDDEDGLIDCMDVEDCASRCADFEVCDDGIDNDGDGLFDLSDPYCEDFTVVYDEVCWDGVDNDRDGFTDLEDGDCQERLHCDDGIDNDLDGLLDREDTLDCPVEDCQDGIDNDGDGYTDCLDEKCAYDYFCCDRMDTCGGEVCNDGFDNDFDGLVDCLDDECSTVEACLVPGVSPRGGIAGRLQDACGCDSVASPVPASQFPIPREVLLLAVCGGVVMARRRRRRHASS